MRNLPLSNNLGSSNLNVNFHIPSTIETSNFRTSSDSQVLMSSDEVVRDKTLGAIFQLLHIVIEMSIAADGVRYDASEHKPNVAMYAIQVDSTDMPNTDRWLLNYVGSDSENYDKFTEYEPGGQYSERLTELYKAINPFEDYRLSPYDKYYSDVGGVIDPVVHETLHKISNRSAVLLGVEWLWTTLYRKEGRNFIPDWMDIVTTALILSSPAVTNLIFAYNEATPSASAVRSAVVFWGSIGVPNFFTQNIAEPNIDPPAVTIGALKKFQKIITTIAIVGTAVTVTATVIGRRIANRRLATASAKSYSAKLAYANALAPESGASESELKNLQNQYVKAARKFSIWQTIANMLGINTINTLSGVYGQAGENTTNLTLDTTAAGLIAMGLLGTDDPETWDYLGVPDKDDTDDNDPNIDRYNEIITKVSKVSSLLEGPQV